MPTAPIALLMLLAPPVQEQAPPMTGTGGLGNTLVMFAIPLLIFWLVMFRPERKERKRKAEMLDNLKKNDRVLTSGGLYASVAAVHEQEVVLKFDDGATRVRALKSAIASVLTDDDTAKDKPQG